MAYTHNFRWHGCLRDGYKGKAFILASNITKEDKNPTIDTMILVKVFYWHNFFYLGNGFK